MEIALYRNDKDPIASIEKMGTWIAKSGMFGCTKPEQGQVIALTCWTEGITPIQFNRTYDVLGDGKIRKKANAALADFRTKGGKHKWIATGDDGKAAELELTFDGQTIRSRYTIDDAKKAGLIRSGSAWEKTPANMLRVRAVSNGITMIAPEIYSGIDDDGAEVETPAAPLTMPSAPVQATVVADDEKELAAKGLAPEPIIEVASEKVAEHPPIAPKPAAKPAAATVAATPAPAPVTHLDTATTLTEATVTKLESAIGDNGLKAHKWFLKEGWLKEGQTLENLTPARANNILTRTKAFLAAVNRPF